MKADRFVILRTTLRPGDLGSIIHLHGVVYAKEHGFDQTFEAYVAGPLSQFALSASPRERLWIAEQAGTIVGCIAIVAASVETAQLRWYLVEPGARGAGLGRQLLNEAIAFARAGGFHTITLWTVSALSAAAHLYVGAGFRLVEDVPGRRWGVDVIEQRYELELE